MDLITEPTQETLWRTLHTVSEWVKFADAKAGATLALSGAMLALLSGRLREVPEPPTASLIMLYVSVALAGVSALLAVWTVLPRTRRLGANSLIHYGTIARFASAEHYRTAMLAALADPAAFDAALAHHVWTIARAATRKYVLVTWAIRFLAAALVVGVATVV
ncbi:Pycsar system effector family protein [Nocardia sp. NPDC048505]|uniref:Pycsar system effector family protein n=1 Tax=unclassified Nocardia TaxID=2637762 RepID=UPI0034037C06